MVVLAAAPCRPQRRHRLDIRAESSDRIPPETEEKEEPDKGRRPGRWRPQETESACRISNAGAGIPALYLALLGGCA